MNKKGKVDEQAKKRTRKVQKFQKAIVGMTLDDLKKKKAQKPELRQAAADLAAKEAKARQQKKASSASKSAPTKGAAKAKVPQQKLPKNAGGAPKAGKDFKGKK